MALWQSSHGELSSAEKAKVRGMTEEEQLEMAMKASLEVSGASASKGPNRFDGGTRVQMPRRTHSGLQSSELDEDQANPRGQGGATMYCIYVYHVHSWMYTYPPTPLSPGTRMGVP